MSDLVERRQQGFEIKDLHPQAQTVYNDLVGRRKDMAYARKSASITDDFIKVVGAKDEYGRNDLNQYLTYLWELGYKTQSGHIYSRMLKLLYDLTDSKWYSPRLRVDEDEVEQLSFSQDEVTEQIRRAKVGEFGAIFTAHLALATTYGFRAGELLQIKIKDDGTIPTKGRLEKHSKPFLYHIPPQIKPYLKGFELVGRSALYSSKYMNPDGFFPPGYGWHSFRRSLVECFMLTEAKETFIARFMRWKLQGSTPALGMLPTYAVRIRQGQLDVDIERHIYQHHPFLPLWGKEV